MAISDLQDLPGRACSTADRWVADVPPLRLHHAPGDRVDHAVDVASTRRTCEQPVGGLPLRRVLTHEEGSP